MLRAWPLLVLPLLAAPPNDALDLGVLRVKGFASATVFESGERSAHWRERRFRQWSVERDGTWRRVVALELGPKSRHTLSGYVASWRRGHACTADEIAGFAHLGRAPLPPQLTFEGVCEPGDRYVIRVLVVGDRAYELHVDGRFASRPALHAAMRDLLGQVEVVAETPQARGGGRDRHPLPSVP